MPDTIVYIDGFNLYYGALRGTPFKWLDVRALCARMLPTNTIAQIRYFTANVSPGLKIPNATSASRFISELWAQSQT